LQILKIVRSIGLGVTNPYLVVCDDDKQYVAKFPGNPDGTRVLINEFVCGKLAKIMGIPIPNFKIVSIEDISLFKNDLANIDLINGSVFCSEYLEKTSPVFGYEILTKIKNKTDAIKILIFDVLIGNNDRNIGNLLINFKNNSIVAIDHSHVFVYEALWDSINLPSVIGSNIDISQMKQQNFNNLSLCINNKMFLEDINDFLQKIKNISRNDIAKIIDEIPSDWQIKETEKLALINFLMDRINRIDEICNLLKIESEV